jgi:hypothetical protein
MQQGLFHKLPVQPPKAHATVLVSFGSLLANAASGFHKCASGTQKKSQHQNAFDKLNYAVHTILLWQKPM